MRSSIKYFGIGVFVFLGILNRASATNLEMLITLENTTRHKIECATERNGDAVVPIQARAQETFPPLSLDVMPRGKRLMEKSIKIVCNKNGIFHSARSSFFISLRCVEGACMVALNDGRRHYCGVKEHSSYALNLKLDFNSLPTLSVACPALDSVPV